MMLRANESRKHGNTTDDRAQNNVELGKPRVNADGVPAATTEAVVPILQYAFDTFEPKELFLGDKMIDHFRRLIYGNGPIDEALIRPFVAGIGPHFDHPFATGDDDLSIAIRGVIGFRSTTHFGPIPDKVFASSRGRNTGVRSTLDVTCAICKDNLLVLKKLSDGEVGESTKKITARIYPPAAKVCDGFEAAAGLIASDFDTKNRETVIKILKEARALMSSGVKDGNGARFNTIPRGIKRDLVDFVNDYAEKVDHDEEKLNLVLDSLTDRFGNQLNGEFELILKKARRRREEDDDESSAAGDINVV